MTTATDLDKRTVTIERTFNAPIALAWEAWTQSEHIANWWAPKGMTLEVKQHDFREGGDWEYTMIMPNGNEFKTFGTYSKIVEQELIESSANFLPMTEGVTIVALFSAAGDQTNFTFKVIHPTEEYCRQQEQMGILNGWGSVFTNLGEYLTELMG